MNEYRLTWKEYFTYIAYLSSLRSKDPGTKVGAVIVNEDNKLMSMGYNGAPRDFDDNKVPWAREPNLPYIEQKYPYMCHAEMNAVVNYGGSLKDFKNATVYVTLFPCDTCAKLLAQLHIKKIIYIEDKHHDDPIYVASRIILDECGIEYEEFKPDTNIGISITIK